MTANAATIDAVKRRGSAITIPKPPESAFKLTKAQDRAMDCLISDATHIALGGGARSGKTLLLVRAVIIRALKAPNSRHAIFRFRFNALKSSVIYDTLPKVRFIPTGVGNAIHWPVTAHGSTVHPHGCGERNVAGARHDSQHGSSPRVWGTL